jgi:DNA-binding MarR family transcriptional regulator
LDKRAFDLTLTDAGNTAVVQAATTSDHVLAQFSAALTPTEQEQFSKLLQKLNEVNY